MGLIKSIILLPFLPIKWAWKLSSAAEINGRAGGCAHVIGFLIVSAILYGAIGGAICWGIMFFIDTFGK